MQPHYIKSCRYFMMVFGDWSPSNCGCFVHEHAPRGPHISALHGHAPGRCQWAGGHLRSHCCLESGQLWSGAAGPQVRLSCRSSKGHLSCSPVHAVRRFCRASGVWARLWASICRQGWGAPGKELRLEGMGKWNLKVLIFKLPNQLLYLSL